MKKIVVISAALFSICTLVYAQNGGTPSVLNLEECIRSAFENSPRSELIAAQHLQARTSGLSTLSPLLPFISLSSGWNRSGPQVGTSVEVPGEAPIVTEIESVDNYQTNISVAQTLVDASAFAQVSQIPNIYSLAETRSLESRAELAFSVKQQYYNLIQLHSAFRVSQAAVKQVEQQVEVAREQFDLGAIARPELLRVQVALIQRRVEMINAQAALVNGRRALANLIGADFPVSIDTALRFPDTAEGLPLQDSLLQVVLERNPSFQASRLSLQVQESNELASRLRIVPSVSGSFTYGYSAPDFWAEWQDNDFWSLGVDLSWSIFERLNWYAQVREASAQTRISQSNAEITRTSVVQQMNESFANLQAARETLLLVPDLLEQAREEFRLTQEQFRLGAASSLDFLQSQLVFNEAQQQAVTIITNYHLAQAQLLQLMGEW
ncbi:MAG: TolC family protein [Chitinispirillaceae bacterium]